MILCKLILLAYLAFSFIHIAVHNISWIVFSVLLYLCLTVVSYLVKKDALRKISIGITIVQILIASLNVQPLFILLLPLSLCEFLAFFLEKKIILFVVVLLPVIWLQDAVMFNYGLVAALSAVVYTMAVQYTVRLQSQENQLDIMRKDLQKLSKHLNENQEFIRQSEYTYKLEERNRLAQVFHDKIGHAMTGALIQMEASKRLFYSDKEKAEELLQNAINISKAGIESIRLTLKSLKPPTEQVGLHRLKLFIEGFSAKHGLQCPFVSKGNMELITPIQWKIIQENVMEALTNSLKYANAAVISIEIHVLNKMVKVDVKDNGIGVQKVKKGLGIIGMEERTASINGNIIVDGTNGFTVTMLLPLQ